MNAKQYTAKIAFARAQEILANLAKGQKTVKIEDKNVRSAFQQICRMDGVKIQIV